MREPQRGWKLTQQGSPVVSGVRAKIAAASAQNEPCRSYLAVQLISSIPERRARTSTPAAGSAASAYGGRPVWSRCTIWNWGGPARAGWIRCRSPMNLRRLRHRPRLRRPPQPLQLAHRAAWHPAERLLPGRKRPKPRPLGNLRERPRSPQPESLPARPPEKARRSRPGKRPASRAAGRPARPRRAPRRRDGGADVTLTCPNAPRSRRGVLSSCARWLRRSPPHS
jgi:hypothetical protein